MYIVCGYFYKRVCLRGSTLDCSNAAPKCLSNKNITIEFSQLATRQLAGSTFHHRYHVRACVHSFYCLFPQLFICVANGGEVECWKSQLSAWPFCTVIVILNWPTQKLMTFICSFRFLFRAIQIKRWASATIVAAIDKWTSWIVKFSFALRSLQQFKVD